MGILVVVGMLVVLSVLAMTGRVVDSRDDNGRYGLAVPRNPGRDPALFGP